MATLPIGDQLGQVIVPTHWPPAPAARLAAKLLDRHSPHEIAEAVEVLIDLLDLLGGDPDQEDDDPAEEDDPQGQCDEDEVNTHFTARLYAGPGCPLSDPGEDEESGVPDMFTC